MSIANEIVTRGWHQDGYEGEDGSVCVMGAAIMSAGWENLEDYQHRVDADADRRSWATRNAVCSALGVDSHADVWKWNDAPGRTFDEVLRVARIADEILDAQ